MGPQGVGGVSTLLYSTEAASTEVCVVTLSELW